MRIKLLQKWTNEKKLWKNTKRNKTNGDGEKRRNGETYYTLQNNPTANTAKSKCDDGLRRQNIRRSPKKIYRQKDANTHKHFSLDHVVFKCDSKKWKKIQNKRVNFHVIVLWCGLLVSTRQRHKPPIHTKSRVCQLCHKSNTSASSKLRFLFHADRCVPLFFFAFLWIISNGE